MAALLTLLFKKDKDVLDLESDLGKLKTQDGSIQPINFGKQFRSFMVVLPYTISIAYYLLSDGVE